MILHIPHAKTVIPPEERGDFLIADLDDELEKMTDWGADRIFSPGLRIEFPYSRLLCDVERFAEGDDMEACGHGVCYTHTADGRRMRFVTREKRKALMTKYYYPHHRRLEKAVDAELHDLGRCLIIDCHSFPARPLPYEHDLLRPDFCIGFDERCRPTGEKAAAIIRSLGYSTAINRPFAGALMPIKYLDDPRVESVMIEANRGLVGDQQVAAQMELVLTRLQKSYY
jgi:N-formylglutamate deformylase